MTACPTCYAVSMTVVPRDDGGADIELRGLDRDAVYRDALTAKNAIDPERVPVIAGQFRDIETGEWVVRVRTMTGPMQ